MPSVNSEYDHFLKMVLVGDSGIGKSCILNRYADDTWTDSYISRMGVDFKTKTISIDGKTIKTQVWDTFGQEPFHIMQSPFRKYREAHAVIIVFDLTSHESFEQVRDYLSEVARYASENAQVILVGNKVDLVDKCEVQPEEIDKLLFDSHGSIGAYVATSAKTAVNVNQIFETASRLVLGLPVASEHSIRDTQLLAFFAANHQANAGNPLENHVVSLLPQIESMLPPVSKPKVQPNLVDQIEDAIEFYNTRFKSCWACLFTRQSKASRVFIQTFEQNKAQWRKDPELAQKAILLYLDNNPGRDLAKILKPLENRLLKLNKIAKIEGLCNLSS